MLYFFDCLILKMHKKLFFYFAFIIFPILFLACSEEEEEIPDLSQIPKIDVEFTRIERELLMPESRESIASFINQNPEFSDLYFKRSNYPHDSILINTIYELATDVHTDTLLMDTEKIFGEMEDLEEEFELAFRLAKYYYPDFVIPKIYTSVSGFGAFGFGKDLFITDSVVVIGLEYFTGVGGTYFPQNTPQYILRRLEKDYIVPNTLMYISQKYNNYDFKDKTLLADMLYYGKAIEFTNKLLPYKSDSVLLGYTTAQLNWCQQFEDRIFGVFVEDNVFYKTSNDDKNRYVGERPSTPEVADNCPPRIGRWLGWEIIKQFQKKNPEVDLKALMDMNNAQEIFQKSRYKPQR